MPSEVDQNMAEDAMAPADDMEEIRRHVKEESVRCLKEGLAKDQIFRRLRGKGFDQVINYAVYKEFRSQNKDFFKLYMLRMSLIKQIRRLNRQLARCRELLRGVNASAGDHQGCNCGNSSCSGHQPVAVPVQQHAEATLRATSPTPLAVALPAAAMAQHAHRQLPGMPPPPNHGGRPGWRSRGAVRLSAAGQMPETPWQSVPHVNHPARHAVPNGWAPGHGPSASGTSVAGMGGPSPPPAQWGPCLCAFHRQVGSQHQHQHDPQQPPLQCGSQHQHQRQPQQQPLQHGGGNVGGRQRVYRRATPSQLPLTVGQQQQQQGYQAEQRWHAGANSSFAAHQNLQHLPPQQPLQQGGGNVGQRQEQFCPPTPSPVEDQLLPPSSSSQEAPLALQAGEQQQATNGGSSSSSQQGHQIEQLSNGGKQGGNTC